MSPEYGSDELLAIIREAARARDGKVVFSKHAREQMAMRDIAHIEVLDLLASSFSWIADEPMEESRGDWRVAVSGMAAGRGLNVAVAVKAPVHAGKVVVITAFYE